MPWLRQWKNDLCQKDNNKNGCLSNNYQPIFTFFLLKQWNNWFINYFWGALVEDLESLMEAERRRLISSWRRTLASFCRWANSLAYSAADSLRFKQRFFFNARRCLLRWNDREWINCNTKESPVAFHNITLFLIMLSIVLGNFHLPVFFIETSYCIKPFLKLT